MSSAVGVATASPPVLGDTVASTSTRAEDNVRKVVKALLAVNEQVKATDLGAHLGIGKTAIYARLRGEKPFTVGEIAVLSEYFRVPVGIFYTGPEALFGNLPERAVGGRAGVVDGDYPSSGVSSRSGANAEVSGYSANPCLRELTGSHDSDTVVVSLAAHRGRRAGVAA